MGIRTDHDRIVHTVHIPKRTDDGVITVEVDRGDYRKTANSYEWRIFSLDNSEDIMGHGSVGTEEDAINVFRAIRSGYLRDLYSTIQHSRKSALRLIEDFDNPEKVRIEDGVPHWVSNNCVPPADVLALWEHAGLAFDHKKSIQARDAETTSFLNEYRKREMNREHSPEEIAEMRAAFGEGYTVVNVITGQTIKF